MQEGLDKAATGQSHLEEVGSRVFTHGEADGACERGPFAARRENDMEHFGDGGLALGPRDANDHQFLRGVTVPPRASHGPGEVIGAEQCAPCV